MSNNKIKNIQMKTNSVISMQSHKVNTKRRKLVGGTLGLGAVGAALPSTWTKPLVSAVVTPAHAMTSPVPGIGLVKTVYAGNDGGASCPGMDQVTGMNGDAITYCFVVTNTGDTYLNDIVVNDTTLGIDQASMTLSSGSQPLAPGESLEYYYESTITGDLTNNADTSGNPTDMDGTDIPDLIDPTDNDTAVVVEEVVPVICPSLVIDNISFAPQSTAVPSCGITFELLSSDPAVPLTITSIVSDVAAPDIVTDDGLGEVTDAVGVRVTWIGATGGACSASGASPIIDVAFTVTASCAGAVDDVTLEFNLTDLAGVT